MIVRVEGPTLSLISQPDHAALASRIMAEWRANGLPAAPRRAAILKATAEHDNGWREPDSSPMVDQRSGRICDFMDAPASLKRGVWPRGVARLADDPWCAALVAQHALHVYARYRMDPEWRPFFVEMQALRDRSLLEAAPLALDDLLQDYLFVRLGDLISLTFCNGWTEPQQDLGGYVVQLDGSKVKVTPDPFEGRQIPLEVSARALPNRTFSSDADAAREFENAGTLGLTGRAIG